MTVNDVKVTDFFSNTESKVDENDKNHQHSGVLASTSSEDIDDRVHSFDMKHNDFEIE